MSASGLVLPSANLNDVPLQIAYVDVSHLVRVHWPGGHFRLSRDASCRFDEPIAGYASAAEVPGTCYFGTSVALSFAESVLHEIVPGLQATDSGLKAYVVSFASALASRSVSSYRPADDADPALRLVNLAGSGLHQLACSTTITSTLRDDIADLYAYSQAWAKAIRTHPDEVDGIRFVPSHINDLGCAIALFEHAMPKVAHDTQCPLPLVQSDEQINDFAGLVELFRLGFSETEAQIVAILRQL